MNLRPKRKPIALSSYLRRSTLTLSLTLGALAIGTMTSAGAATTAWADSGQNNKGKTKRKPVRAKAWNQKSKTGIAYGHADIVIDRSMDDVSRVLEGYAEYKKFIPNFTQSRVLSKSKKKAVVYMQCALLNGTIKLWSQTKIKRQDFKGKRVYTGTMERGNFKHFFARWTLWRLADNKTKLRVTVLVAPDIPVPNSLVSDENRFAAYHTANAIRKKVHATSKAAPARAEREKPVIAKGSQGAKKAPNAKHGEDRYPPKRKIAKAK